MATEKSTGKAVATIKKRADRQPSGVISLGYSGKSLHSLKQLISPALEHFTSTILLTSPLPAAFVRPLSKWLQGFKYKLKKAKDQSKTRFRVVYITPAGYRAYMQGECIRLEKQNNARQEQVNNDRLASVLHDLNERVKEQTCLYGITKLTAAEPTLEELLQKAVRLIPPGWQFPEHACCSISYGKLEFKSAGFRKSRWSQDVRRSTYDGTLFSITVYYKKQMPDSDEGPFLKYERTLLNSIADSLVLYISQLLAKNRSRLNERMLKEAQELALIANWSYDLVKKKNFWSDSMYAIFGVEPARFPESYGAFFKLVVPEDRKRVEKTMMHAIRKGVSFLIEYCIKTTAGTKKYIEEKGYAEKDPSGRIIRLFGTVQDITQRKKTEQELADAATKYRSLFEASPVPSYIFDAHTLRLLDVNQRMIEQYGYSKEELLSMTIKELAVPDQHQQAKAYLKKTKSNTSVINFDVHIHRTSDGKQKHVSISRTRHRIGERDCILELAHDITEQVLMEKLDQLERNISEMSLRGSKPLHEILENYLVGLEELIPGLKASILKIRDGAVYNLVSPSLPDVYVNALNGLAIGPAEGSCGTAAYTGKQVIVTDIGKDPLWKKYKGLAQSSGLNACWSTPLFNPQGQVVATFANYYASPRTPALFELEIFNRAGVLISILMESDEKEKKLEVSYERFEYVTKATSDAIWDWNLVTNKTFCGEGFTGIIGQALTEEQWNLNVWLSFTHPDDRMLIQETVANVLAGKENRWEHEYRVIRADQRLAFVSDRAYIIRDKRGKPIRIIGAIRDITLKKEEEQRLELFESVVKNTSDAVVITNAAPMDGTGPEIIYVNEAFTRMTGYAAAEVIHKTPRILQGPKSDWAELSRLKLAMKRGESCELNTINYSKEGNEYRVEMAVKPVFDENGKLTHFFAIQKDITEPFRLQRQLRLMEIVNSTFKQHESLVAALGTVLKKLVEFGDFTAAETWLLAPDKRHFSLVACFGSTKEAKDYFNENKTLNTLTPDGGLLKDIWDRRELIIADDFDKHPTLRRREGVQKAGFKSAVAIPLLYRGELIGVLTVLTDKKAAYLYEFEQLFRGLESDLGSEVKRKQLENELSVIFNTAPDIIAMVGFDGYFKRINPAATSILGYSNEELLSRPYNDFIHPDSIGATDVVTHSLPEITGSNYFENCYISKSGKPVWLAWTYQQLTDEGLVFSVAKDITRQKELQRLLADATNLARIGAWEMDLSSGQIKWSDVTREIHEVPADYQPVLEEIYQFYQEADKFRLEACVKRALELGESYDLELLHVTARGNERWVRVIGTPEFFNGRCTRLYGSFQDIHAGKLADIELQQRTRYLSAIATVAQIFLSNEDWLDGIRNSFDLARYTMMADQIFFKELCTDKETGQSMFRQRLGWLKGLDHPTIDPVDIPMMPVDLFPEVRDVLLSDQHYTAVISELPDNTLRQVLVQSGISSVLFLPVFNGSVLEGVVGVEECTSERRWADGEIFFMRSLCSSLSSAIQRSRSSAAQKKLNEDLVKQARELMISNAELEQFAYVSSHDLQEPLRMITSFLTKLEGRYANQLDDRGRRYIGFAVDGANRMRQNVLGLLQYSRVGRGDTGTEEINLNEVVEEICLLHQSDIKETGARIEVSPLPVIHNYMAPVVQLLNNLLSNALKYRKPDIPPQISISARSVGDEWEIAVRDNGIGIEKEYLQKIFVIFQRLHQKDQYEGTGIGLAVVKKIAENLGGRVWVESVPGTGSTFYFTIRSITD
jgi:PAS domain S-box-containing protein